MSATTYNPAIEVLVDNVGINKLCPDFLGADTLGELQALNIFSQLEGVEQDDAYDDLLEEVVNFNGSDDLNIMSVNHTNGVADNYSGTGSAQNSGVGAGLDGSGNLILTPANQYWKTHDIEAVATKLLVKTNIVAGNLPSSTFQVSLFQARKSASNAASYGSRISVTFGATSGAGTGTHGVISGGPTYAGNVEDDGTFFAEILLNAPTGVENEIGSGAEFGNNYYYIIVINVPSGAATKNYKLKVDVDYDY